MIFYREMLSSTVDPLSMGLRVRHPVSVFPSSGVLSIRLDDRAGLSLFGSIFIHVIVDLRYWVYCLSRKPRADPAYLIVVTWSMPHSRNRGCIIHIHSDLAFR